MAKLTQSMSEWLWRYHRDKMVLIMFGHMELFTDEMTKQYIEWCNSDDGRQYLKGGAKYREEEDVQ